jgi:5-methyltetrahydrofolate--homocysteine methyltransferase
MIMATAKGLDGAIGKGMDRRMMMAIIFAAEPLAGRDNFCMNDLKAFRAGMFEG